MQPKISVLMNDILHSVDIRRNIFKFKTEPKRELLQKQVNVNKRFIYKELKYINRSIKKEVRLRIPDSFARISPYIEILFNRVNIWHSKATTSIEYYSEIFEKDRKRRRIKVFNRIMVQGHNKYMKKMIEDKERLKKAICILCKFCNNPKQNFTCIVRKAYYDALDYDVDDVYDDSKYYTGNIFKKIKIKKADRKEIIKDELVRYFTRSYIKTCCYNFPKWLLF